MNKFEDLEFSLVQAGSPHAETAFQIQEQYKKYFFVPEPAFRSAVKRGLVLGAFQGSELVAYLWSTCKDGVVRVRYLAVHQGHSRK